MPDDNQKIFISYTHDSEEHIKAVLNFSNKLRADGFDCHIDQYEVVPPEGWPRWMDRQINNSDLVLVVCTENYFNRVMGDESPKKGLGVKWEGKLIYQHIYGADSENTKFIPIIKSQDDKGFIPVPLKDTSSFLMHDEKDYERLCKRLAGLPMAEKPPLGEREPLPEKEVKTDFKMFLSSPIDVELWNKAKWAGTMFAFQEGSPPMLGLAFNNRDFADEIFENWHERYGAEDEYEELRVSIIEGYIPGEKPGYSVHISHNIENILKRYEVIGFEPDSDMLMMVSRINRMIQNNKDNLETFKKEFKKHGSYLLIPAYLSEDERDKDINPGMGIVKKQIFFRRSEDIKDNDEDYVVIDSAGRKSLRIPRTGQ